MTGKFPLASGVHDFGGNKLEPSTDTIAKVLRAHGYSTAAFIGSAVLDSRFGLGEGFDTYFDHFEFGGAEEVPLGAIERRGDQVVNETLKWLKSKPKEPVFVWVHLYDPHAPYSPPEPYAREYLSRPYDGEIAFADAQVGRLIVFLRQQGLFENTLLVLASDHGESLGEHGETTHGFFIYNSTLHVPLIFRKPGIAPHVLRNEVSLVDVMPTILEALGIPIPSNVQGRSLMKLILNSETPDASASNLYAENYGPLLHFGWNRLQGLQWRGLKYIDTTRPELYDTRNDPHELHNLIATRPILAAEMNRRLESVVRRLTPASAAARGENRTQDDPALAKILRSLGYVAVPAARADRPNENGLPDPKDRIQVYELVSAAISDDQGGRYEQSLKSLREAERTEPNSVAIHFLMGRDYLRLKDFQRAAGCFQSVLVADPKYAIAVYYLGLSQLQAGELEEAQSAFSRTLELDPGNFSAAYDLGVVHTRQHQAEAAIVAFQRAIGILPEYAEAHEALGELYLYEQRSDDAVRELEHAIAIAPGMAKAHYELARAYAALGLKDKAQQEFDRSKAP